MSAYEPLYGAPPDPVHLATYSGDLNQMLGALSLPATPTRRHFLLQAIVGLTYKLRADPAMRAKCREVGLLHLAEFPAIAPLLRGEIGIMPRVTSFPLLATLLAEDGDFDGALEVCRAGLAYGLRDGTKSGYEGRIGRLEKKRKGCGQPNRDQGP